MNVFIFRKYRICQFRINLANNYPCLSSCSNIHNRIDYPAKLIKAPICSFDKK